jgi:hypothetical protein
VPSLSRWHSSPACVTVYKGICNTSISMGWFFIKNAYGYAYDEFDEQLLTAVIIHKSMLIII